MVEEVIPVITMTDPEGGEEVEEEKLGRLSFAFDFCIEGKEQFFEFKLLRLLKQTLLSSLYGLMRYADILCNTMPNNGPIS